MEPKNPTERKVVSKAGTVKRKPNGKTPKMKPKPILKPKSGDDKRSITDDDEWDTPTTSITTAASTRNGPLAEDDDSDAKIAPIAPSRPEKKRSDAPDVPLLDYDQDHYSDVTVGDDKSKHPSLVNAFEWSMTRATFFNANLAQRLELRKLNSALYPVHLPEGGRPCFEISNKKVQQFFPDWLDKRHGPNRPVYMIKESSFLDLNESRSATYDSEMMGMVQRASLVLPAHKPRTVAMQFTNQFYVSAIDTMADPFVDTRLHALALSSELQDRHKSTGQTLWRIFWSWTCAGPGTVRLYPWSHEQQNQNRFRNVYMARDKGSQVYLKAWLHLLEKEMGPDAKQEPSLWCFMLLAELTLIKHNFMITPSDPEETARLLLQTIRPVWSHTQAKLYEAPFSAALARYIPQVQRAFC